MSIHPSEAASQSLTLAHATRLHTHWTQHELDQLKALRTANVGDRQIALKLHRSLFAVRSAATIKTERREHAEQVSRAFKLSQAVTDRFTATSLADMGF